MRLRQGATVLPWHASLKFRFGIRPGFYHDSAEVAIYIAAEVLEEQVVAQLSTSISMTRRTVARRRKTCQWSVAARVPI